MVWDNHGLGFGQVPVLWVLILVLVLVLSVAETALGKPTVRRFKWDVEYVFGAPDCIEHPVMAINGQFPGPTIRAKAGDIVHVDLTNKLGTEGVVIHWHGIRQIGTPWADGTAAISQCAINPGETFTYRFVVDKPGTYFYHGHYGMQRSAGLYGSLIVDVADDGEKDPFHYDGDFDLLLSDWWHKSVHEQELGLSSVPMRWINEPDSLLINGRGQYNCSLAAGTCKFTGSEKCTPKVLRVHPNKTYRIRFASTTALASLNIAIANHKMLVVEADGNYVEPFEVDDLYIYSGESYSVLIKTDQDPTKNYWIAAGVVGRKPNTTQALTLLNYDTVHAAKLPASPPPATPVWNDTARMRSFADKLFAVKNSPAPPRGLPHRRIALLNTQNYYGGQTKWAINNVSLSLPATPYLGSLRYNLRDAFDRSPPPESFPAEYDVMVPAANQNCTVGNGVYLLRLNSTVDVVLQNANALSAGTSEVHPWHLHGHNFWVLGYGEGKFMDGVSEKRLNLRNPPLRNTVVIFPYGWTVLRFVADNPGAWAFHCHIEPHLHMGMGVVMAEGVNRVRRIPGQALGCGLTAKMVMKNDNNNGK